MGRLGERRIRWLLAGVGGGCFVLLLVMEVVTDPDPVTFADGFFDALEMLLTIGSAVGVALLAQRMQAQHEERLALIGDLKVARAEGEAWRAKVQSSLEGIRVEMENQFRAWRMTAAEREVGLLILKGLSHKQIAALRKTGEATVRQQAQAIYRKAGLPGKTAFSAYFLEDLLAPEAGRDGRGAPPVRIAHREPERAPERVPEPAMTEPERAAALATGRGGPDL